MHALLVDDEPHFAEALAERLTLRGVACSVAFSGEEALHMLASSSLPDIVFLDVHMPGMDGLALLRRLGTLHPEIDVVMLSGASDLHLAVRAMRRGAVNWLPKPVEVESLLEECRHCTERRRQRRREAQLADAALLGSLGRVAEGVAHEVNNPVNIMVQAAGWVEDLLDDAMVACHHSSEETSPLWEEMRGALGTLRSQSLRVREITQRLLVFGKGMDKSSRPVDMPFVMDKALGMLRGKAAEKNIGIHVMLNPALPHPLGSAVELHQACVHILENALDAMPGGGKITVYDALRQGTEAEDPAYLLHIKDNGPGIAKDVLPHIFEPFFSTQEGRAGLGLAVCQSLLKRRDGEVQVDATPAGSCFTLILPLA